MILGQTPGRGVAEVGNLADAVSEANGNTADCICQWEQLAIPRGRAQSSSAHSDQEDRHSRDTRGQRAQRPALVTAPNPQTPFWQSSQAVGTKDDI